MHGTHHDHPAKLLYNQHSLDWWRRATFIASVIMCVTQHTCMSAYHCYGSRLHTRNSAPATGATASHAAAATYGQQQPFGEGPNSTPMTAGPQLLSHSSASTPAQPASLPDHLSTAAQTHDGTQTNSTAPPLPMPPTTVQQSLSKSPAAPTTATPAAVAAPPTGAITPDTGQVHASAEQTSSPQPAVDSTLPGQQQQQTSKEYSSTVSAIDDLSELELDADTPTPVPATVSAAPHPPAPAAAPSASQKRFTCAPVDLTSPTIPSAKKHKLDDGSARVTTADRSSAQLTMSAETPQLAKPPLRAIRPASLQCLALPYGSKPPSETYLSMHTMASSPSHEYSQKAAATPMILTEITESAASRTTLPQCPHPAASEADSVLFEASQRLVLSMPASNISPPATAAFATVSCQLPSALSIAAAQQFLGTAATASKSPAGKEKTPRPSIALLSHRLVTFHARSNPTPPCELSAFFKPTPSSYQPIIEELPPDSTPTATTTITAAANKVLPSKPAMVIDIDSDDDHNEAINNRPAAPLQDRQGQDDKLAQSHDGIARLSSKPAMPRDHATEATTAVNGRGLHPTPTAATTPYNAIKQANAIHTSLNQPSAPMGMGHIFSSFSAFEDLSDGEEEDAQTESAAAASRAAGLLQHAGPAGGFTSEGHVVTNWHSLSFVFATNQCHFLA